MIRKYKMSFNASAFLWALLSLLLLVIGFRELFSSFFIGIFTMLVGVLVSPFSDDFIVRWTKYVVELKFLLLFVLVIVFVFVVSENFSLHAIIRGIFGR